MKSALDTPMMRQYLAIKANHPDAILLYRMGDFYEMFLRDAEIAAPLLDIALTTRDKGKPDAVPMCGIPVHAADPHVKKLAELGYRVAICEQVEDAREAAGRRLVKRDVVEVVTPGLAGDPEGIEAASELALVALDPGAETGFAVLDASTGDFRATQVPRDPRDAAAGVPTDLAEELRRVAPREVLVPQGCDEALCRRLGGAAVRCGDHARGRRELRSGACAGASGRLVAGASDPPSRAAAALLAYVGANQPFALAQVGRLRRYGLADAMVLDASTQAHLELFRNSEDGSRRRTLLEQLDRTRTPLGARRLTRWLAYPLLSTDAIAGRQDAVAWLAEHDRPRARLREALRDVRDLERLFAKAARPGRPRATSPPCAARWRRCRPSGQRSTPRATTCSPRRRASGPRCWPCRSRCRRWPPRCARRWSTTRPPCRAARGARARRATSATASTASSTACARPCAKGASGSPGSSRRSAIARASPI